MQDRAEIDQHRPGGHRRLDDIFLRRLARLLPSVAARDDARGAVLEREIGQRPIGADLPLDAGETDRIDTVVPMQELGIFTRRSEEHTSELPSLTLHSYHV